MKDIPIIPKSDVISKLAKNYHLLLGIPDRAKIDCYHLAVCVDLKIDCLLSWNCTHLGMRTFVKLQDYNDKQGLTTPLLLTPEALIAF
jgi:hypothetical protein